eukprot:2278273-Rhodomonas_salina.3
MFGAVNVSEHRVPAGYALGSGALEQGAARREGVGLEDREGGVDGEGGVGGRELDPEAAVRGQRH